MLQTVKWIGQGKYATMPSPEKKMKTEIERLHIHTHLHTMI